MVGNRVISRQWAGHGFTFPSSQDSCARLQSKTHQNSTLRFVARAIEVLRRCADNTSMVKTIVVAIFTLVIALLGAQVLTTLDGAVAKRDAAIATMIEAAQ